MALLALLTAGTSWAVALWVSVWLVPPYLLLMALLLSPSTGRPSGDPASEEAGLVASANPPPARPVEETDDPDSDLASEDLASAGLPKEKSEQGTAAKAPRARRGKGRVKKVKAVPEPVEAIWLEVAPGKFVRVETADGSTGQAGPHPSMGTPVEVPSTPQRLEEPPESPDGDPTGDVEPTTSTAWESDETAGSSGTYEANSAADGNAPQAEETFDSPEPGRPNVPFEVVDDQARDEPGSPLAVAGVCLEQVDECGAPLVETDPTETPVDETDLDDAGLIEVAALEPFCSNDADFSGKEANLGPSAGSPRWPWRLAPGPWNRVGYPPRAGDRRASPRRPVRSQRPSRRPTDPRRLERRGVGRPRQGNRTFPPRSPPTGRLVASG